MLRMFKLKWKHFLHLTTTEKIEVCFRRSRNQKNSIHIRLHCFQDQHLQHCVVGFEVFGLTFDKTHVVTSIKNYASKSPSRAFAALTIFVAELAPKNV